MKKFIEHTPKHGAYIVDVPVGEISFRGCYLGGEWQPELVAANNPHRSMAQRDS